MSEKEAWHVDKKIPIVLIITMAVQFIGFVWFVSKLDSRVGVLERDGGRVEATVSTNTATISGLQIKSAQQDEKLSAILRTVERIDRRLSRPGMQ